MEKTLPEAETPPRPEDSLKSAPTPLPGILSLPTATDCNHGALDSCTTPSTAPPATDPAGPLEPLPPIEEVLLIEALKEVIDPELFVNVIDLGLIYEISHEEGRVSVLMTLTSPACPAGPQLVQQSKMAVERVAGVRSAEIKLTLSPPWTPARMTDDARDQLGIF